MQLTLFKTTPARTGTALRDEGMQRAVDNAESVSPGWRSKALDFVRRFPGSEFMVEQIREFAYANGLDRPPHDRAWGSVITEAKRLGIVEFARYGAVTNPKAHRTPASVWRKVS